MGRTASTEKATLCGDPACQVREMQARVRVDLCARNALRRSCVSSARHAGESATGSVRAQPSAEIVRVECAKCRRECPRNPLRRSCMSSSRNAGESAICEITACVSSARNTGESVIGAARAQPSAEIVRVECAKSRRECNWCGPRATLCGDRACRAHKMQARVRLVRSVRNPLRTSCVSSARNSGESALCPVCAQPSAEIVRVECAKCRRERDAPWTRGTLCGDRAFVVQR